jgi:diguanylate cyclase (GGDEF)-like protein
MHGTELLELVGQKPRAPLLPRHLSDEELAVFIAAGKRRELGPGEVIFRRGELGRSMFVIDSGQILLEFGNGLPDKVIGAREFFGELALFIGNHARVANALSVDHSVLHVVENGAFEGLLEREPQLLAHFMRRSFAYLVASEQQLIASLKRRNEDLMVTLDSLRQTQSQLLTAERMIQTDELTTLCNRRGLYQYLDTLESRRLPNTQLGLLLIDLDRFKQINDHHGHLLGDMVLRAIAQEIQVCSAAFDMPCRLGGDEFALLAQVSNVEDLTMRATSIVTGVRSLRFGATAPDLRISVSVGAALCPPDKEWSMWYADADCALYEAKGSGGDAWRLHEA